MSYTEKRLKEGVIKALADPETLDFLFQRILDYIQADLGGERVYIRQPSKKRRNDEIKEDFESGNTILKLCQKYGLSESQLYKILGENNI